MTWLEWGVFLFATGMWGTFIYLIAKHYFESKKEFEARRKDRENFEKRFNEIMRDK